MKRTWAAGLSFIVPVLAFTVLVTTVPVVGDVEAKKKAPPKKGDGGAPAYVVCEFSTPNTPPPFPTPKPIPPLLIPIGEDGVDAAVQECLGAGGRPHGVS